jgi:hypothetical protein
LETNLKQKVSKVLGVFFSYQKGGIGFVPQCGKILITMGDNPWQCHQQISTALEGLNKMMLTI